MTTGTVKCSDDEPRPEWRSRRLSTASARQIEHVVVVVPARNEGTVIGSCLRSIEVARRQLGQEISTTLIVVADRCEDDTVDTALVALRTHRDDVVLVSDCGRAGAARSAGTGYALAAITVDLEHVWIANTDADTVVSADWLTAQLDLAARGFVAVAGTVALDRSSVSDHRLLAAFDSHYTSHADGTHPHVHGANLGVRADLYERSGGWNPLATGEDHDLWNRLKRLGPVASPASLLVTTSARLIGRAPEGFAADLRELTRTIDTVA